MILVLPAGEFKATVINPDARAITHTLKIIEASTMMNGLLTPLREGRDYKQIILLDNSRPIARVGFIDSNIYIQRSSEARDKEINQCDITLVFETPLKEAPE